MSYTIAAMYIPVLLVVVLLSLLAAPAGASARPVYVVDALGDSHQRPSTFGFSVNGDLVARNLEWTRWGRSVAKARGIVGFYPRPAGTPGVGFSGTLTLSRRHTCGGRTYYSRGTVKLDKGSRPPWRVSGNLIHSPC